MSRDEKIVKVLKRVLPIMSILTVLVFVMLINKKSYALFHKRIETDIMIHIQTADEMPKSKIGTGVVKDTIGQDGGITGLDPTTGEVCNEEECKEYRYSGPEVNNYIYFNCESDATEEDASGKCELWRILGIFKDDSGNEHLKIVRDNVLTRDMFPAEYKIGETTYNMQATNRNNYAYWNKKVSGTNNNDWATAGLQYWLNTTEDETAEQPNKGYLCYLKGDTLSMIEDTKYYLGTVTYDSGYIIDTPKEAYVNERAVEGCEEGENGIKVGPTTNSIKSSVEGNESCRVWANNNATWTGKIALLYPSDYGFSAKSGNWETQLKNFDDIETSSWLNFRTIGDLLLSPSSNNSNGVASRYMTGYVSGGNVYQDHAYNVGFNMYYGGGVRPTVNLLSGIKITSGDGTSESPYFLEI